MVKPFKNIILQNQKANATGTWYVALGYKALQVCSNDDPRLTFTYITSRLNLLHNALNG